MKLSNQKSKKLIFVRIILLYLALWHIASCRDSGESGTELTNSSTVTSQVTERVDRLMPPTPLMDVAWTDNLKQLKRDMLGEDCMIPCLLSLKPGETSADEAFNILEELIREGVVNDFRLRVHPTSGTSYVVGFSAGFSGDIGIDEERNIVTRVGAGGFPMKFISFGDLIDAYGTPDKVAFGQGDSFEGLYLAYFEKQIFAWVVSDNLGDDLVSPELTVVNLNYLSPDTPNSELELPSIKWIPWEGYKPFAYYYNKSHEAEGS